MVSALTALPEDLGSILSTHIVGSQPSTAAISGSSNTLFMASISIRYTCAKQAYTIIIIVLKI